MFFGVFHDTYIVGIEGSSKEPPVSGFTRKAAVWLGRKSEIFF